MCAFVLTCVGQIDDFDENIVSHKGVVERGERLRAGLRDALKKNAHVKEVRGLGLITGVQLDVVRSRSNLICCDSHQSSLLYKSSSRTSEAEASQYLAEGKLLE